MSQVDSPQPENAQIPTIEVAKQQSVYYNLEQDSARPPQNDLSGSLEQQARSAYIGKVYVLLTIELGITFGICMLSQYCQAYRNFQLDYAWVVVFPILLIIGVFVVACCVPKAREFPLDMVLTLVFVLSFAYCISMTCSAIVDDSIGPVVPIAVVSTVAVSLVLTVYAFLCKGNFLVWLGIILVCCPLITIFCIVGIITNIPAMTVVWCSLAVAVFAIYLVIMTKFIIGDGVDGFPLDAPILASLFLYLYIMRIFLYILIAVGASKR